MPCLLIVWVLDFLTERMQQVFVTGRFSDKATTFTGSPQGCVLSPILFILYTDDCRCSYENRFLVKFSDDTALLSLLDESESSHGPALTDFVDFCDTAYLDLNVTKTKDMLFDFRRNKTFCESTIIHGEEVETVKTYKYLGTTFDDKLTWNENTEIIAKKGQQRVYLLRKLNSFSVNETILSTFYRSFIESVICFSFVCWFYNLNVKNRNSLLKIVRTCSKIIGKDQRDLGQFCDDQLRKKAKQILRNPDHVLSCEFNYLPSGRRYRGPPCRTNRFKFSFVPRAICLLNE